jgi:hypothetical protein
MCICISRANLCSIESEDLVLIFHDYCDVFVEASATFLSLEYSSSVAVGSRASLSPQARLESA